VPAATAKVQNAVGVSARAIAGLVDAIAGISPRVGQKGRVRLVGVPPVPWRHADAANVQVPYLTVAAGPQPFVEDEEFFTVAGGAEWDRLARIGWALRHGEVAAGDGRLRGAV